MTEQLKPCPFCEGRKKPLVAKYVYGWKVSCTCGAKMSHFDSKEIAIAAWNRRPEASKEPAA